MPRHVIRTSFIVLASCALVAAVIFAGRYAFENLPAEDNSRFPFASIECAVLPKMTTADFLDEVRYVSRLPEEFSLRDKTLARRLATAFEYHPWVQSVERVRVIPPDRVIVELRFRRPVLAVRWKEELRVVDGEGILLPRNASADGLPIYEGTPSAPKGAAGAKWGDAGIMNAAARSKVD